MLIMTKYMFMRIFTITIINHDESKINTHPNDLSSVLIASVGANCGKLELEPIVKVGKAARLYLYLFYI